MSTSTTDFSCDDETFILTGSIIIGGGGTNTVFTSTDEWTWEKQYHGGTALLRDAAHKAEKHCSEYIVKKRVAQAGWKSRKELRKL